MPFCSRIRRVQFSFSAANGSPSPTQAPAKGRNESQSQRHTLPSGGPSATNDVFFSIRRAIQIRLHSISQCASRRLSGSGRPVIFCLNATICVLLCKLSSPGVRVECANLFETIKFPRTIFYPFVGVDVVFMRIAYISRFIFGARAHARARLHIFGLAFFFAVRVLVRVALIFLLCAARYLACVCVMSLALCV